MTDPAPEVIPPSIDTRPWLKNFDIDQSRTPDRALSVIDWARSNFSQKKYEATGRNLSLHWESVRKFKAYAAVDLRRPNDHIIGFSELAPKALHRDAVSLTKLCAEHFTNIHYDDLFGSPVYDYGQGRHNVLPPGITEQAAADQMFRLTFAWLYLHEQAHHFQGHLFIEGAEPRRMIHEQGNSLIINDATSHVASQLTPQQAAMSHITELAADAEATGMAASLIIVANDGVFSRASLWLLVCGLMCLFQRFHGGDDDVPGEMPVGSHPLPAFRMRMVLQKLLWFANLPRVRDATPWAVNKDTIIRLVDHASTTASVYWSIRSMKTDRQGVPPFYQQIHTQDRIPETHSRVLFESWSSIRSHVENYYFGWYKDGLPFDPQSAQSIA
ncbi:hypothetical protein [Sphingomonas sp. OK281]|jgi:hypothetical protein|uniref:hypothetical protein n=1 Tax=Sphingomonas sp. OK281 TaxID=1881067 RepID=UPI0008DEB908|nr:hypothetical protein [Sphingomonas sp. OK281]SFO47693.1 hypothetical protein SAMN05428984_4495 [Sphingomonas sp. OK281]